jgi:hypothetical protein
MAPFYQPGMPSPVTKNCIPKCHPFGTKLVSFCAVHQLHYLLYYLLILFFPYNAVDNLMTFLLVPLLATNHVSVHPYHQPYHEYLLRQY